MSSLVGINLQEKSVIVVENYLSVKQNIKLDIQALKVVRL